MHLQVTRGRQLQRQTCSRSKAARGSHQVSGAVQIVAAHSAKSSKLDTSITRAWRALNAAQQPCLNIDMRQIMGDRFPES